MSFTDIFIRRPVLATVVSLMILLVGLAAAVQSVGAAVSRDHQHDADHHHGLSRRQCGAHQGVHHHAHHVGGRKCGGYRHADLVVAAERQHHHLEPAPRRQRGSRRVRRVVEGAAGQEHTAARGAGSDRHAPDGRYDRADVHVVQQQGDDGLADHRLSDARGATASADDRRRRQRADPGRADLRHAHLAQPRQDGGARHHAARRAHGADREQLRHGGRAGEGRLRPDEHQCPDAARQPRLRSASWWWRRAAMHWSGSTISPPSSWARRAPIPPRCSTV